MKRNAWIIFAAMMLDVLRISFNPIINVWVEIRKSVPQEQRSLAGFLQSFQTLRDIDQRSTFANFLECRLGLFPENIDNHAVISTHDLLDATKRVALVVDREKPLRYSFSSNELVLESIGSDVAEATEQVPCSLTGDPVVVSLRPQFLSDALGGIEDVNVKIAFTTNPNNPNKPGPVLISAASSKGSKPDFKYLLQPNLLVS